MDHLQLLKRIAQGVIRRRKRLLVWTFLLAFVVLMPAAYVLSKEPPRFRTSATVLLEARPDRVPLFQEFSPFRPLPVQLAILRSRSLAEGVIESLPKSSLDDLIQNPYYVDYSLRIGNFIRRLRGEEPEVESPQRRALKELQAARVSFVAAPTGIVDIVGEASKPQVAVDIVNTYVEVLLSRTRSFNIDDARVSREFLEQQVAEIRKTVQGNEEALRSFNAAHGGVKVPEQSQAAVTQLSQAEGALAEAQTNRKMIETRLAALREKVEKQKGKALAAPSAPPPEPTPPSADIQRLRSQLAQLETALLDLRTKYTDEHPRIVLIKDRIAEVQRQLGDVVKETTPVTPIPGAVPPSERINFAEQLVALESSYHVLVAQEEALRTQVGSLRQSLGGLSRSEVEYARLTREVDSASKLQALLSEKLEGARIREQGEMKIVKIIDPAAPAVPAAPDKRIKFLGLAFLLALATGGGVPTAIEWIFRRVESEHDVEESTGLPVLAVIPHVHSHRPTYGTVGEPGLRRPPGDGFIFTEAVRGLRVAIQLAQRTEGLRTILITSALDNEGKSMLVLNLGLAFREAGKRIGLADTDFHRPTLHRAVKVPPSRGLAEALHTDGNVEHTMAPLEEGMWLAPRGQGFKPLTRGLMATGRLTTLIEGLAEHADIVLCDSSPLLLVPDSLFLASAVDGVVLVARAGATPCRDLARAKSALEGVGARIIGVVINDMPVSVLRRYYRRYYNAYVRSTTK
jgi:capsular exopolysaccharide synthesis family protein